MPYKKNARRGKKQSYTKKAAKGNGRSFKRKFKTGAPRSLVPRGTFASSPYPSTLNKVLTYTDNFYSLNQSLTDVIATVIYSGNSMYDPDVTQVGNQPKYFDSFCGAADGTAPYRSYRVLASKIKVTFMPDPTLTSANNLMTAFVLPIDSGGGYSPINIIDVMERPYCKYAVLGNTGASFMKSISMFCKSRSIFGTVDPTDDEFAGDWNTDPTRKWQWYIGLQNIQPSGVSKALVRVQIKYYCQFFNLNRIATS